jgi:DNA helicase-2/ATP-dependent DNA helicase PcrA
LITPLELSLLPRDRMPLILPDISDADVDEAARLWDLKFDAERRAVLRCMSTTDIRACPGSGKTTLLVAKLGMLAAKWPYRHKGMCILSHTNAARDEVQKKLAQVPALRSLLGYPHFLGTVQVFLHRFLAVPAAVEHFGVRPVVVDDVNYEVEAARRFTLGCATGGPYRTAAASVSNWCRNDPSFSGPADWASRMEYHGADLSLPDLGTSKQRVGWDTETGKQLLRFKMSMSKDGYFRFQDMVALAAWYAKKHPRISGPLCERFPMAFFDEMQDTVVDQGALIGDLFAQDGVVQRFGDDRQAIFHTASPSVRGARFPEGTWLSMCRSFRLSPSTARLAQNVCVDSPPENLLGDDSKPNYRHTVFIFTQKRAADVLPEFCRLVLTELGAGLSPHDVKAVGANTNLRAEPNKYPSAIGVYWPLYAGKKQSTKERLKSLDGYLNHASSAIMHDKSTGGARRVLLAACVRMLRLQGVLNSGCRVNAGTLPAFLRQVAPQSVTKLDTLLARTCLALAVGQLPTAAEFRDGLRSALSTLVTGQWKHDVTKFVSPQSGGSSSTASAATGDVASDRVFRYSSAASDVCVGVDTIHSVKGRTLKAILVLETFVNSHDLFALAKAGYLLGQRPTRAPGEHLSRHLKRVYVAMTRPTGLLCLAMLDSHVTVADRLALERLGWHVQDIH